MDDFSAIHQLSRERQKLLDALLRQQGNTLVAQAWEQETWIRELQELLRARLPEHMQPQIVALERFPLSSNGKINVQALPTPAEVFRGRVAPSTSTEQTLLELWTEVLQIEEIGTTDDFFRLGGNSLTAIRLISAINLRFGVKLPPLQLFRTPTVAQLAPQLSVLSELMDLQPELEVELPTRELSRRIALDPSIHARNADIPANLDPADWNTIFFTGATGYFGSHLLSELLRHSQARVICLVRARDRQTGMARIRENLARYTPLAQVDWNRIEVVPGDLAQPCFGLDLGVYEDLGRRVEGIVHAGAVVNFALRLESLEATNIGGCEEILRLAVQHRLKPVHFVSTMNIFSSTNLTGRERIAEDEDLSRIPSIIGGYAQSRWIAEGMVQLATSRGIPVTVYRPSILGGPVQTGISNENDALCRLFKGCIQLGAVPALSASLNVVPADFAASALVHLMQQTSYTGRVFHLVNPMATPLSQLFKGLKDFGYALRQVRYDEWQHQISAAGEENALFPLLSLIGHLGMTDAIGVRMPMLDGTATQEALAATQNSLHCPPIDQTLMFCYLEAMVESGFIPRPGGTDGTHR